MTEFSAYHTIRSIILEYVEPYIIKLIDPKHPDASCDGYELWQAVDDNNLECVILYVDTGNIDTAIITAIQREYISIIDYLLPYIFDPYEVMCAAIRKENMDLMARIYAMNTPEYWEGMVEHEGGYLLFDDKILIHATTPVELLVAKWFLG